MWHLSMLLYCCSLWENDAFIMSLEGWWIEKNCLLMRVYFQCNHSCDKEKLRICSHLTDQASYQDRNFVIFLDGDPEDNKQGIGKKYNFFGCQRAPVQPLFIFFLTSYIKRKNLILLENKILKTFINLNFINWGGDFRAMTGVLIKENRIPNQEFENWENSQCWWKVWIWRFKELMELFFCGES